VLADPRQTNPMERRIINPWAWQDGYGFVQANELSGVQRILVCSGQASVDANGHPLHKGDMLGQLNQALDNLETVLGEADFAWKDVVRLNIYTTDVDAFNDAALKVAARLRQAGLRHGATLVGVTRLFEETLMVELEATAMA